MKISRAQQCGLRHMNDEWQTAKAIGISINTLTAMVRLKLVEESVSVLRDSKYRLSDRGRSEKAKLPAQENC